MTEVRMSTNPKRRPTPGNQPSVRRSMPSIGYWLFSLAIVAIVMTIQTTVYLSGSDDGMLLKFDAEEVKEESLGSSSDSGDGKGISDEAIWSKFDADEVEEPQLDSVDKRSRTYSVAEFYKTDDDLIGLDEDDDIVDDDNDYSSADDLQGSHEDSQIIETTGVEITEPSKKDKITTETTEPSTKDKNTTETTEPSTKDKITTETTEPSTKDGNCDKFKEGDTSPLENVDSIFNCGSASGKCHWFYPGKFLHASCGIGKEFTPQVNRMKYLYKKDNLWIAGPPIVLPTAKIVPENMRINPFREGPWPRHNLSMIHVHKTGGTSLVLAFDGVLRKGAMGKRRTLYFPRKKTKRITQQQRKESKEKRLSEGSRFLDNAVKYRQQWKENEHTIFAVVRDPVDRFISAIGQATGALGSTTNGVGKNLLDECLKETSKETLNCFINLVHTNSTWLEVHFTPMLLEIAFATVYKDIPVAVFPFEEVPSLMVELGSNPKSKKKDGSAANYRKSEVLTSMSVEDYDEGMLKRLCDVYKMDAMFMNQLKMTTKCDKFI